MELEYKGGNCVVLQNKQSVVVVDDNLEKLGQKSVSKKADVVMFTHAMLEGVKTDKAFVIDGPGEYEIKGVSVRGIPTRAHMDEPGQESATLYTVVIGGTRVAITGHIYPELSDDQLEQIGLIDVLIVPVGGNGYTLDPVGAYKIVKAIDPRIVVPTHYNQKGVKYEVPQQELAEFLKEIGQEGESIDKLKIKSGQVPESLTVYKLQRS